MCEFIKINFIVVNIYLEMLQVNTNNQDCISVYYVDELFIHFKLSTIQNTQYTLKIALNTNLYIVANNIGLKYYYNDKVIDTNIINPYSDVIFTELKKSIDDSNKKFNITISTILLKIKNDKLNKYFKECIYYVRSLLITDDIVLFN